MRQTIPVRDNTSSKIIVTYINVNVPFEKSQIVTSGGQISRFN